MQNGRVEPDFHPLAICKQVENPVIFVICEERKGCAIVLHNLLTEVQLTLMIYAKWTVKN